MGNKLVWVIVVVLVLVGLYYWSMPATEVPVDATAPAAAAADATAPVVPATDAAPAAPVAPAN